MKNLVLLASLVATTFSICYPQEAEYDRLLAKIEAERMMPSSGDSESQVFEEYLSWLGIKAADRDQARALASRYSMEGNPYWEERFLDLVREAQESGESTLWSADRIFVRLKKEEDNTWTDALEKSELYGKKLFLRAGELGFDDDYIRESVRCLMRFALGNLEMGKQRGLYLNRDIRHGTQFDDQGNAIQPDMDFGDVACLPRSAFHVESEGTQGRAIDKGLADVERIRDVCEWFQLHEYQEGTDLMNQFLQDFLCDDSFNPEQGLDWYLSLAQKYELENSVNYILGFYGALYGKVEVQEGKQVRDAPHAEVKITSNERNSGTEADESGNYVLDKAPLHCKCPPVPIFAEYEGDRVKSKYKGQLAEPDPGGRHKKDLLILGSGYAWTGTINLEITERFNCSVMEKTSELGSRELTAADEKRIVVNISVGMDDFDLPGQSTNAGSGVRYVSGDYTLNLNEDHLSQGRADKTQCHNDDTGKWEWISPGNWNTRHETKSGQAFRDINIENLTMLIVKDIGFSQSSQLQMQKQIQEAAKNMDLEAIEALKQEMMNMVQGDKNADTFPVVIRLQLAFGGKPEPVTSTYFYQNYDVCLGSYADDESRSNTIDMPVVAPLGAEFKGSFTRSDKGQDKIKASILETETSRGNFYSGKCPEKIITIKGEISLERNKE